MLLSQPVSQEQILLVSCFRLHLTQNQNPRDQSDSKCFSCHLKSILGGGHLQEFSFSYWNRCLLDFPFSVNSAFSRPMLSVGEAGQPTTLEVPT